MHSLVQKLTGSIDFERSRRSESGDTLVEVLLAMAVIGIASVAILLAFATSISGSAEHRTLTTADTVLRTAAEQAISQAQQASSTQFGNCPTAATPPTTPPTYPNPTSGNTDLSNVTFSLPAGYTAVITSVAYWNTATSDFTGTCVTSSANSPQVNSPQLVQVTVTSPSGTTSSISFVVNDPQARGVPGPGAETHLAFITPVTGTNYVVHTAFPSDTQPVVAVEDANNRVVTSDGLPPVTLTLTPPPNPTAAQSATTLGSNCAASVYGGVISFSNCSINAVGNGYTLTATDSLLPVSGRTATTSFNVVAAPPSQFVFTSNPVSGSASLSPTLGPITVQEQDVFGNPTTAAETVNLSTNSTGTAVFSAIPGGSPITSIAIPAGSSSATFYYGDTMAGTPTITASGLLTSATQVESVVGGPGTQLDFTTSPSSSTVSSKNFAPPPVVTVEDAFGNVSTADSSTVTLSLSGGAAGATLSNSCSGAEVSGVVTFSGCSVDKVGTGYILTATDGTMTPDTSTPFAITLGLPSQFVITSTPVSGVASSTTTAIGPITVQEQDAGGNPTTKAEVVTLSSSSTGTKKFGTSPNPTTFVTSVSIPAGSSSTTFYYGDTLAGTPTITVSGSLTSGTQTEAVIGGAASKLAFSPATPGTGTAGSAIPNVVVQAQDAFGNVAPAANGSVVMSIKSGAQSTFNLGSTTTVTMNSGVAAFTNLSVNAAGSTYALTATPSGITGVTNGVPGQVSSGTFTVAPAAASVFAMATPSTQAAGTAFSVTLTAKDAFGNTITSYAGPNKVISFSGPSKSPNGASSPAYPASVTFTAGVGTASGITLVDAQTTSLTATDTVNAITGSTGSFTVGSSTVTGGTISTPSAVTAGSAFTETIKAIDVYGNTATSITGPLATTFSGPSSSPGPVVTAPSYPATVNFTAGVATASITLFDAQTTTLSASLDGGTVTTGSFTVSPASASDFSLTNPGTQSVGTAFNETITAIDPYGNTATSYTGSQTIVFSGPLNSPGLAVTAPSYPPTVSFTAGVGTASITLFDAQTTSLIATQNTLTQPTGNFIVSPVAPVSVAIASSGGGGTGAVSAGDTVNVGISQQINASTLCSTWSNSGTLTQSLANATITLLNAGGNANDTFTVSAPTATCSGNGNFGTVGTGANYVNGNVTFTGSTVKWNPTTDTLTFTLGTVGTGSNNIRTGVTGGKPGYTASGNAKDVFGNAVSTAVFTSGTTSKF